MRERGIISEQRPEFGSQVIEDMKKGIINHIREGLCYLINMPETCSLRDACVKHGYSFSLEFRPQLEAFGFKNGSQAGLYFWPPKDPETTESIIVVEAPETAVPLLRSSKILSGHPIAIMAGLLSHMEEVTGSVVESGKHLCPEVRPFCVQNDPAPTLFKIFRENWPGINVFCHVSYEVDQARETEDGRYDFTPDPNAPVHLFPSGHCRPNSDGVAYIELNAGIPLFAVAEILAHELAHAAEGPTQDNCDHGPKWGARFNLLLLSAAREWGMPTEGIDPYREFLYRMEVRYNDQDDED